LIRALSQGGYADIRRIKEWNLDFVNLENTIKYKNLSDNVKSSLNFIKASGLKDGYYFKKADFYTAHESMLLNYESALTRKDSVSGNYYGCSAHMLWIGERTRLIDEAHVEFVRGIGNPIGVKIGPSIEAKTLIPLISRLNPSNEPGKITLISRMGVDNIATVLPNLLRSVKSEGLNVVW
jgi:3-deoxy-7-phosphoheptulonate synthase